MGRDWLKVKSPDKIGRGGMKLAERRAGKIKCVTPPPAAAFVG